MTLRTSIAAVSASKNPPIVHHGRLAEDYDGIGEFVAVSMSLSSTSSAFARVAPGAATTGQTIPAGTPVSVVSQNGHLEVVSMGSKVATGYSVTASVDTNETEATIEPVNLQSAVMVDYTGGPVIGQAGFEGSWRKLAQAGGVYNSDFETGPLELDQPITADNLVPYWDGGVYVVGSAQLQVIETGTQFGKVLRCTLFGGRALGDLAWIAQTVPCMIATTISVVFRYGSRVDDTAITDLVFDWLDEDLNFLRRDGAGQVTDTAFAPYSVDEWTWTTGTPPIGAVFLTVWVGLRAYSADAQDFYLDIIEVVAKPTVELRLIDQQNTDGIAVLNYWDRRLFLEANVNGAGYEPFIELDGGNGVIRHTGQWIGRIEVTPVNGVPTDASISGLSLMGTAPFRAVCSAVTTNPGDDPTGGVAEVSVNAISSSGVTVTIYRRSTTTTAIDVILAQESDGSV